MHGKKYVILLPGFTLACNHESYPILWFSCGCRTSEYVIKSSIKTGNYQANLSYC